LAKLTLRTLRTERLQKEQGKCAMAFGGQFQSQYGYLGSKRTSWVRHIRIRSSSGVARRIGSLATSSMDGSDVATRGKNQRAQEEKAKSKPAVDAVPVPNGNFYLKRDQRHARGCCTGDLAFGTASATRAHLRVISANLISLTKTCQNDRLETPQYLATPGRSKLVDILDARRKNVSFLGPRQMTCWRKWPSLRTLGFPII
jgi:hypothetical protein